MAAVINIYFNESILNNNNASDNFNSTNKTCEPQRRSIEPGTYLYYISVYVFPIWLLMGMFGNALILLVLRNMKQKNKCFLSAMAVSDFCYFVPMFLLSLNAYDSLALNEKFLNFSYHFHVPIVAMANLFSTASIWFVVFIAVERLVVIRNPLSTGLVSNNFQCNIIIISIFIVSAVIQLPRFFGYSITHCFSNGTKVYSYEINHGHENIIALRIARALVPCFMTLIPTLILIYLNTRLVYYVRMSSANVVKFGLVTGSVGRSDTEKKVTRLVMVILITFLLFNMPSAVIVFLVAIETNRDKLILLYGLPVQTSNNLVTLNKVLNFFLYFCSSSQFRRKLKSIWRKVREQPTLRFVIRRTSSLVFSLKSRTSLTKANEQEIEAFRAGHT